MVKTATNGQSILSWKNGLSDTIASGGNMEGELISDIQVWFGIREPEWWPEDEEEFEERFSILRENKIPKKRIIRIKK
jgi:hypothetical protein